MFRSTRTGALALAACLLGAQACSDAPLDPAAARPAPVGRTVDQPDTVEPLVRAFARALAEPAVRRRVFEDLRDSPFRDHRLPLQSYLRGASGQAVLAAGARATGQSQAQLMELLRALPPMEIVVPVELHRLRWTGTADVMVAGSALPRREIGLRGVLHGYTTDGRAVSLPATAHLKEPLIAIWPTEYDFGADPEAARQRAPRRDHNSVSIMYDEFSDCDPRTAKVECETEGGSGGPVPGGIALPSGFTYQCMVAGYSPGDEDGDGVLDSCEYEIAYAFRPYLTLAYNDFDTRREEYWAGKKGDNAYAVQIFYALSYYNDGGDPETMGSYSHQGDSEWIVLQVSYHGGKWRVDRAKLSAHWGAWTNSTETVSYGDLQYPDGVYRGRLRSWAARNKHANYKSLSACDSGAWWADNCDTNWSSITNPYYAVEILADANLGNSWHTDQGGFKNCVLSREGQPWGRWECYWLPNYHFFGWQDPSSGGAGVYYDALTAHGF